MSTIHDGTGYLLRQRRRPRDSASMRTNTKAIFNLPQQDFLTQDLARKFYASKLTLPIILPIDEYNYNMNGVDRADQLRAEFRISPITSRNWMPYFFWLLDHSIINAYLLWK
jgi:hypothetical protein